MATIIMRIITIAMSISVFFTSALPAYLSGDEYKVIPEDKINTYSEGWKTSFDAENLYTYKIISDYSEWADFAGEENACNYNEEYFRNSSLVIADFTLPNPGYEVLVFNAAERGEILDLDCLLLNGGEMVIQVIAYEIIIIETSKNIKTVDISTQKSTIPPAF